MTFTHGMGLIWMKDRWANCSVLAELMGFPVRDDAVVASCGPWHSYSDCADAKHGQEWVICRSHHPQSGQIGNTMVPGMMGMFELVLLLFHPPTIVGSDGLVVGHGSRGADSSASVPEPSEAPRLKAAA